MRNRLVRKYQPQDAVGIDWSNPLTRGLRALVNAAGAPRDAVTGRLLVNSGMTLTPYRGGSVYAATVAATTRIELPFDLAGPAASIHVIAARDASATGASTANPRSVAALFSDSTIGSDPVFWEGNLGNSFGAVGDVNKPRFGTNAVGIGTIYRDGVALSGNNPATTALTNGQMYAMSFVASSGVTPSGRGKLHIFNARNLFTTDGRLQFFGLWGRALTAAEVRHLNENPWQLFAPRRIWVPVTAAAPGSITGTLAATETGSDTASFAGDVLIDGTLAASETGSDTAAFAGDVYITGTLAATESGSDTAAFTGTSAVVTTGTLAATETGSDTAAFAGDVLIDGALAATESGSDTAAFAGDVLIDGTLSATESGSDTAAFTGTAAAAISGTLAASESGSDTAAFTNVTATRDGEGGGEGRIRRGVKPKRKPKYLIEVDGKFVVVDSPEEARQVLSPKPVKKGKKAAKKAAPAPSIAPVIDLGRVEDYADLIGEIEQFDAAMQSRHYQQILAMFDQMQDDEDVELLLLAL